MIPWGIIPRGIIPRALRIHCKNNSLRTQGCRIHCKNCVPGKGGGPGFSLSGRSFASLPMVGSQMVGEFICKNEGQRRSRCPDTGNLHEISIRIQWRWSRTPKSVFWGRTYITTPDIPPAGGNYVSRRWTNWTAFVLSLGAQSVRHGEVMHHCLIS